VKPVQIQITSNDLTGNSSSKDTYTHNKYFATITLVFLEIWAKLWKCALHRSVGESFFIFTSSQI